jgi:membrane protease YdiL (CAAX protease family)
MLTGALIAYRIEGNPLDWGSFASRFRLQRMGGRDWAVTGLGYIIGFFGSGALLFTTQLIATIPLFAPPAALPPVVNPLTPLNIAPTHFMDVPLAGNWWVIALYLGLLFFNIVGEEFWWRGYILPRQELQHGRWTWVLHGLMWTLFHVPIYPWSILSLLPTCLSLAYVAQRTRNTWPGIITHFLTNGLAMLPLVLGVLGIKLG